jgi:mono/diheme cytochrome c family protein
MRPLSSSLWVALSLTALLAGCRGQESDQPPVHLNPNMDSQPRYDAQSESKFFEDRRTMRSPVEGTVAKGNFLENDVYATGKDGDQYVAKMPVPITESMLKRGQQQYNIYCTPCHDATGSGMGLVVTRGGYPQATNLNEAYSRTMPDGQIYGAMAYGIRNMPSYAAQMPVEDRWAVVSYVRALQFSQNATIQDVPADKRGGMPVEAAK